MNDFIDPTYDVTDQHSPLKDHIALLERHEKLALITFHEVEQTLGKALGYPWFKDDRANFPDATEADRVCVGEHVPESIALEVANKIKELEAELAQEKILHQLDHSSVEQFCKLNESLEAELANQRKLIDVWQAACEDGVQELKRAFAKVSHLRGCLKRLADSLEYRHEPDLLKIAREGLKCQT